MKLDEGEYICDKCNGRGSLPTRNPAVVTKCPKCLGKKKVDWIENVVGVTKNKSEGLDVMSEWSKIAAEAIAKKIDDDIIKKFLDLENENNEEKDLSVVTIKDIPKIEWNILKTEK